MGLITNRDRTCHAEVKFKRKFQNDPTFKERFERKEVDVALDDN